MNLMVAFHKSYNFAIQSCASIWGHFGRPQIPNNVPHGGRRERGFTRPWGALPLKHLLGLNSAMACAVFGWPAIPYTAARGSCRSTDVQEAGLVQHPPIDATTGLGSAVLSCHGGH